MADAWSLLGIDHDADAATIRRAYARKLKVTRPDDDPVAFQALVAARQAALDHAEQRCTFLEDATVTAELDRVEVIWDEPIFTDPLPNAAVVHPGPPQDSAPKPTVHVE